MTETRGAAAPPQRGRPAKKPLPARISLFYRQVIAELRKVIWPTRKELITYTTVVIAFVMVVIAYVTGLDFVFSKAVLAVFG
ncbi:MAG TPA: preprotein translocase subunit SecE [Actinomycetes bacterium]